MYVRRYTLTVYDRREMGGEKYEIGKNKSWDGHNEYEYYISSDWRLKWEV
jgi:hypothetical protein